jgi:peptidoglycan-associated lipoprotein
MNRKSLLYVSFVLLAALLSLWGCPKKAELSSTSDAQKETITAPATPAASAASGSQSATAMKSDGANEKARATTTELKSIYFDFDKSIIRDDAKDALHTNAEWLKAHPRAKINIEGNCDERGTKEYNQALGQRRAASAKKYLTALGISSSRISLTSYGKEKLICTESTEECWQKNRRDDFVAIDQ